MHTKINCATVINRLALNLRPLTRYRDSVTAFRRGCAGANALTIKGRPKMLEIFRPINILLHFDIANQTDRDVDLPPGQCPVLKR